MAALSVAQKAGTTAPLYFSVMNCLISSLWRTLMSAWISGRFSSPSRTAMMLT